jgi:hypothetical protein
MSSLVPRFQGKKKTDSQKKVINAQKMSMSSAATKSM